MSAVAEATPAAEQTVVLYGNSAPQQQVPVHDPDTGERIGQRQIPHPFIRQSITRVRLWPGIDDPETVDLALSTDNDRRLSLIGRVLADEHKRYAIALHELEEVVQVHSAGHKPDWVWSSDPELARAAAGYFGCPVSDRSQGDEALLTNGGRDAHHHQLYDTAAPPAQFNYMALTANSTAAAAADTTLTGEITTAGGGLLRAQATFAHTAGTNTSTLTKTFTANGSDALPVTVAKFGIFNAATAGTMAYETLLSSTATLSVSGDNVTVTETLTAG